jgi:hypothetical protein
LNTNLVYVGWIALLAFVFTTDWLSWQQVIKTTQVAIPLNSAARGHIRVIHSAGQLNIEDDARGSALVQGTCRGDVDSDVTHEGDLLKTRLTLRSRQGLMSWRYPWAWEMAALDWNLSLKPRIPLALDIQKGAGEIDLDLAKTYLNDLRIESGDGAINLRLPDNAGQTGVHIQSGSHSVTIHVPSGVAAYIKVSKGQGSLDIDSERFPMVKDGVEYRSSDYDSVTNRVDIHLSLGVSVVKII